MFESPCLNGLAVEQVRLYIYFKRSGPRSWCFLEDAGPTHTHVSLPYPYEGTSGAPRDMEEGELVDDSGVVEERDRFEVPCRMDIAMACREQAIHIQWAMEISILPNSQSQLCIQQAFKRGRNSLTLP